jgi:hypothetical protein
MSTKTVWLICGGVIAGIVIVDLFHHDYKSALIDLLIFAGGFTVGRLVASLSKKIRFK